MKVTEEEFDYFLSKIDFKHSFLDAKAIDIMNRLNTLFKPNSLIRELEDYANSIDADINTINNYDIYCCDERELEVLHDVFNYLDNLIKKYGEL